MRFPTCSPGTHFLSAACRRNIHKVFYVIFKVANDSRIRIQTYYFFPHHSVCCNFADRRSRFRSWAACSSVPWRSCCSGWSHPGPSSTLWPRMTSSVVQGASCNRRDGCGSLHCCHTKVQVIKTMWRMIQDLIMKEIIICRIKHKIQNNVVVNLIWLNNSERSNVIQHIHVS